MSANTPGAEAPRVDPAALAAHGPNGQIVPAGSGHVALGWLPALTEDCRGAVDLTTTGPLGPVVKAVLLGEAFAVAMMIDLACPGSTLWAAITGLAATPPPRPPGGQR